MKTPLNIYADNGRIVAECDEQVVARLFVYIDDERACQNKDKEISLKLIAYLDKTKAGELTFNDHVMINSISRCKQTFDETVIDYYIDEQAGDVQQAIKSAIEEWANYTVA